MSTYCRRSHTPLVSRSPKWMKQFWKAIRSDYSLQFNLFAGQPLAATIRCFDISDSGHVHKLAELVESPIPRSCASDRIVNFQHAIVGFWNFIGMHRCYYLLQHNEMAFRRNYKLCWLIFTEKSIIPSCKLTILLGVDIYGIGSTSVHAHTTCRNGLLSFVGHGGSLVDSTHFVQRVMGSNPALAAT